jgi:secreted PhoX family phosphatase
VLHFTTKGDNRVWRYDVVAQSLAVVYDDTTSCNPILTGVDNVTVSRSGDVFVAEDGGNMQIVVLAPDGSVSPVVEVNGQNDSEITGPAFSPDGSRLYFSSQRGNGVGLTYEVRGPFR